MLRRITILYFSTHCTQRISDQLLSSVYLHYVFIIRSWRRPYWVYFIPYYLTRQYFTVPCLGQICYNLGLFSLWWDFFIICKIYLLFRKLNLIFHQYCYLIFIWRQPTTRLITCCNIPNLSKPTLFFLIQQYFLYLLICNK